MNRKGAISINTVLFTVVAIAGGALFLAIVLPLLNNVEGSSGCVGPMKGVASTMADITGVNMCG